MQDLILLKFMYRDWLRLVPYFLGGFGGLLAYILMLRIGRFGYVLQYVPSISNPVLFTPIVDIAAWTLTTIVVSCTAFLACWHEYRPWRAITLIVLIASGTMIAALPMLFEAASWLILFSSTPLIYLIYKPLKGFDRGRCLETSAYAVVGTWLLVEVGSAIFQVLSGIRVRLLPTAVEQQIVSLGIYLMYAFQSNSAQLLLIVGFSWTTIPLLLYARTKMRFSGFTADRKWLGYTIFLVSIALSVIAIAARYFRSTDLYGVDTRYYLDRLTQSTSLSSLLSILPTDPRIFYVLLLKFLTHLGASNEMAVRIGPLVLIGLNACAFYVLGKEILGDPMGGAAVTLFSTLGPQTAVSLYAGIYANWLSLSLAASAFASYIHGVKTGRIFFILISGLFLLASLLIHPWSGVFYSLIMICTYFLETYLNRRRRDLVVTNTVLTIVTILVLFLVYLYAPYAPTVNSILSLHSLFQISNISSLNRNLEFTMDSMVGGFLSIPFLYAMMLTGFLGLIWKKGLCIDTRPVLLWIWITFVPILIVEGWAQWRLIYLMPIQVLPGIGVYYLCQASLLSGKKRTWLMMLLLVTVMLSMFNYLLRSVAFIPSF